VKNVLLLLFVTQAMLSMETCSFKVLPFDVQRTIFQYIPKFIFREINKEFATTWSITFPKIFSNDLCGLDKPHMIRILLNAAYKKNYDGVENILAKSSLLQQCPDKCLYYCYKTNKDGMKSTIEAHQIVVKYHKINNEFIPKGDEVLFSLLKKYEIERPKFANLFWKTTINKNIMACLAGNSNAITKKDKDSSFAKKERIKISLEVAMSCNNILCIKKCLEIACAYRNEQQTGSPSRRQCTELLRQLYVIVGQHPRLHFILNDFKDEIATQEIEYLNEDIKMTFFDWVCTVF